MLKSSVMLCTLAIVFANAGIASANQKSFEQYLSMGELAEAEAWLEGEIKTPKGKDDAEIHFQLGIVQFIRALEDLTSEQYRYGLFQTRRIRTVFTNFPLPPNPNADAISYREAREMIEKFEKRLEKAEQTLATAHSKVTDPDKVKVYFPAGMVRMDLNGDEKADPEETLWRVYSRMSGIRVKEEQAKQFAVNFDAADIVWLQGYCNLLLSFCDMTLAYDWQEIFERYGHHFYTNVESPHTFFEREQRPDRQSGFILGDSRDVADLIAFIHLINFHVEEPKRMKQAHEHLLKVIELSRVNWKLIQAETDNDLEWVPNPNQTSIMPGGKVTHEMIASWHEFLDEFEAVLQGKKLIPFWRGHKKDYLTWVFWSNRTLKPEDWVEINKAPGINVKKVFTKPTSFDLVMWLTGTAATPYLENGPKTNLETWRRVNRTYRGQFIGFAAWFN